jgi:hypothetical protein
MTIAPPPATRTPDAPPTGDHDARTRRVQRLNVASLRKVVDPDLDLPGEVGPGAVLPRELLSVAGLDLELTDEQWATLSREELASVLDAGVRFESLLLAGFGRQLAYTHDLVDERVVYALHELGEETRHSRLFIRVLGQLEPAARNPFTRGLLRRLDRFVTGLALRHDALFMVMILTGEEGPDLLQARSVEHPDTDPFVREVNRYHRAEEARHLAFGRLRIGELWAEAPRAERWFIRHLAPVVTASVFDSLVHPGVYETVGLPGWKTWNAARLTPERSRMRAEVLRPVCQALANAGAFGRRGVPTRAWRRVCQLDPRGNAS